MFQQTLIVSAISLILLSGCGDNATTIAGIDDDGGSTSGGPVNNQNNSNGDGKPDAQAELRRLQQLENSDAFYAALRDGLVRQNASSNFNGRNEFLGIEDVASTTGGNADANAGNTAGDTAGAGTTGGDSGSFGSTAGTSDGGFVSANTQASPDTAGDGASPASSKDDVTTTNVQEIGVDEQDRMKSDGEYLYIIDNQFSDYGYTQPQPFDAINNPPQLVLPGDVSEPVALSIDVRPLAVDVAPPGATSFYEPTVSSKLRILKLQPEAPDAMAVAEIDIGLNGGTADGMYLHKKDGKSNLILTSSSFNNYQGSWYDPYAFSNAISVIGKLDVTEPEQTKLETTLKIDGQIVSSRRIGDKLFLATRYYPVIPHVDAFTMSEAEYQAALQDTDLSAALPKITDVANNVTTDLVNPDECFVSSDAAQSTDFYYTPDIVTLAVIDLNTMTLKDSECFLGATETLYATPNSVFLATTKWGHGQFPILELDDAVSTTSYVDSRVNTDIHQFSINGSELNYSGSGVVSGHLGWNPDRMPFRMSEKDGHLRVATFSENQNGSVSPINVSVLNVEGDGPLRTVAQLPNENRPEHIGKPGEQLYASRFLGDKGYLVTFRQTDPLYVVDFTNPNDPKLAGELEIDGYSDYLQPIGEDYLLGIGKDAVATPDGRFGDNGGALVQGVKLSLFNVSDANNPVEVQSMVIGERGTNSKALDNHRAITIQRATDTHPTRVAFGINVYGLADPRPIDDPFFYHSWNFTGLHGFDIKVGADAGIEKRGVMVVNSATKPIPSQERYTSDDRSVIVGDSVYYIYGPSVFAANWNNLNNFTGPR